jgi:hypothetical protein
MMSDRKKLKMVSSTNAVAAPRGAPDPEVRAVAKRRQFNAAYKLSVLEEADRCTSPGAIGVLLRREGLYSSHLTMWRREREAGALAALGRRRGRKAKLTPEPRRIMALEARNARFERELEQARTIIGVQKNSARYWGCPRPIRPRTPGANLERGLRTRPDGAGASGAARTRGLACDVVSPSRPATARGTASASRRAAGAVGARAPEDPRHAHQSTLR